MARNVEIKAHLPDRSAVRERALARASAAPTLIGQVDTFFATSTGRLKLRTFEDGTGELIAYERPDTPAPSTSHYLRHRCTDARNLRTTLSMALDVLGEVRKTRELILIGSTRVHLDHVEGLGEFIELEVVLQDGQSEAVGERIAAALMSELGVHPDRLIAESYFDLLNADRHGRA